VNETGIHPVEYKVLIKVEKVKEKTEGGIIIPETNKERDKFAQQRGELIAVSPDAFTEPKWLKTPKVGDTVLFSRYAGKYVMGNDGEEYKLMNDKELEAIIHV